MKHSLKAKLVLVAIFCGIGISTAKADTLLSTTTSVTADGATGTDPVPTTPTVTDLILIVLQSIM